MLGVKKGNKKHLCGQIPLHYPGDRVYLDGDTTKSVQDKCARKADLTNLDLTGTTNTTGSTIASGTYFYLNGTLVRAKTDIASGATFTLNTNYEVVTDGALNKSVIYSTNEYVVGKWIDGSNLYEKTVDIGALPNATSKSVAHGIANLDKVIAIEGFASNGTVRLSIPYVGIVSTDGVQVYVRDNAIVITAGGDASTYSGYITLRYTKL